MFEELGMAVYEKHERVWIDDEENYEPGCMENRKLEMREVLEEVRMRYFGYAAMVLSEDVYDEDAIDAALGGFIAKLREAYQPIIQMTDEILLGDKENNGEKNLMEADYAEKILSPDQDPFLPSITSPPSTFPTISMSTSNLPSLAPSDTTFIATDISPPALSPIFLHPPAAAMPFSPYLFALPSIAAAGKDTLIRQQLIPTTTPILIFTILSQYLLKHNTLNSHHQNAKGLMLWQQPMDPQATTITEWPSNFLR
ncbi:hypothetical protein RUND412_005808 [Rhizina undulata]